jgi:4a-hydroxytetrahydrobiopterin dehydratase
MDDLTKKKCIPCEEGGKPLSMNEIKDYMKQTRDWFYLEKDKIATIQRNFTFKDFKQALEFVNKVGRLAEFEDHHPDIFIHNYKKVDITLTTHAVNGLSVNDFVMAAKINQI